MTKRNEGSSGLRLAGTILGAVVVLAIVAVSGVAGIGWFLAAPINDATPHHTNQWSSTVKYADQSAQLPDTPHESFSPISQVSGSPAHWCPTDRVIGYRIDTASAERYGLDPQDEITRWRETFDMWSKGSKSAYTFEYRGSENFPVTVSRRGYGINEAAIKSGEIAITYSSSLAHPGLGDAVGMGGIYPPAQNGSITRGTIVMDGHDMKLLGPNQQQRTRVHEAGHALGLGHVGDARQLMYGHLDSGIARPQSGDIEGLKHLASYCG